MLKTILVPLDGSELADRALDYATALAIRSGARLQLVRSVEVSMLADVDPDVIMARATGRVERYLMDVASDLRQRGYACDIAVPVGYAAPAVLLEATLSRADLIVMASHGRTGPQRWLFGSVAEGIVGSSRVPVLVDRAGHPGRRERLLTAHPRLLVALDGSPFAEAALPAAAQLAVDISAELELVRVVERPRDVTTDRDGFVVAYVDERERTLRERGGQYLERLRQYVAERWPRLTVHTSVRQGDPAAELAAAAAFADAALIVMATHGRTGLERSVVGSVAGRVLERGTAPVVFVRPISDQLVAKPAAVAARST
jgi:nucleotide-binding universal stress UspA family protein